VGSRSWWSTILSSWSNMDRFSAHRGFFPFVYTLARLGVGGGEGEDEDGNRINEMHFCSQCVLSNETRRTQ
jgi:hypothetical protein